MLQTEIVNKKLKTSHSNEGYGWNLRLGHINQERVTRFVKDGPLIMLNEVSLPQYELFLKGKMTKRSFNVKGTRANQPLELVQTDVYGPMSISAEGGYDYYVNIIYDYS